MDSIEEEDIVKYLEEVGYIRLLGSDRSTFLFLFQYSLNKSPFTEMWQMLDNPFERKFWNNIFDLFEIYIFVLKFIS